MRPPVKVLVVGDDAGFRSSMAMLLSGAGYDVRDAANAAGARERLDREDDIAAVVCGGAIWADTGLDTVEALATDFPGLAVVITAGIDDPPSSARALEVGAFGYLITPSTPREVLVALVGALRRRALEASLRALYTDRAEAPPIRLLVVDDHQIFVQSLVRLLAIQPGLEVVGTAATAAQAETAAVACRPDVVLMDFDLPDRDGARATVAIRALVPEAKVVMLSGRTDQVALTRASGCGCAGFVAKTEAVEKLVDAIRAAHKGAPGVPVSGVLAHLRPMSRGLGSDLGSREVEVLQLLAVGLSNKAIAQQLYISVNTVRNHVQHVLYKLGVHSKLEAVAAAVGDGLIERGHGLASG